MRVGVLALQGDFQEHLDALYRLNVVGVPVRLPEDLAQVDRLIIPGGESTTIGKLLVTSGLFEPIRARTKKGMPVWGTCAGAILLAKRIADGKRDQPTLGMMDITARRNAFGRQLNSVEAELSVQHVDTKPLPVVFIRAPSLEHPGADVKVLASYAGTIVAAQQDHMLATCFHPELTNSLALHKYFLSL
jgi:5'-phosphate synthase pdxT subunit